MVRGKTQMERQKREKAEYDKQSEAERVEKPHTHTGRERE